MVRQDALPNVNHKSYIRVLVIVLASCRNNYKTLILSKLSFQKCQELVHLFVPAHEMSLHSLAADGILRDSNGTTRQVLPETAVISIQLGFHDNVELTP